MHHQLHGNQISQTGCLLTQAAHMGFSNGDCRGQSVSWNPWQLLMMLKEAQSPGKRLAKSMCKREPARDCGYYEVDQMLTVTPGLNQRDYDRGKGHVQALRK